MRRLLSVTLTGMATLPVAHTAVAADLTVKVEIPRLSVAEYHKPYVSMWVEGADGAAAQTLSVWYDAKAKEGAGGTKWLKDMRQWWRKAGRDMKMPADGVSGATRAPGEHSFTFSEGKSALGKLPAGNYQLVVEAAREVGGRELVRVPFTWPPQAALSASAKGEHELGTVTVQAKP